MNGQDIINFIRKFGLEKKEFDSKTITEPNFSNLGNIGEKEELFAQNCGVLHEMYKSGKIRLTNDERELLEFCHNTDMRKFLQEEFSKNPTPDRSYFED